MRLWASELQRRCIEVLMTCTEVGDLHFAGAKPPRFSDRRSFSRIRQDVEAITYFDQFHKDFAGDFHRSLKRAFHVQASDSPA